MKSVSHQSSLATAVALHRAGRVRDALAHYRRAAAGAPGDPVCGMALAFALSELGHYAEAERGLRALASRHPRHFELLDLWGVVLQRCGRSAEALVATRQAVTVNPAFVRGWCNLGLALLNAMKTKEALQAFDQALRLEPTRAGGHHGRAMALQHLGRMPEAVDAYGAAIAADPKNLETRSYRLMALHYLDGVSREQLWAEHQAFGRLVGRVAPDAPGPAQGRARVEGNPRHLKPRLRLGFISPDLRDHSVAYFLEPLLAHLDRESWEIFLYHDHFVIDAVSERLRQRAHWRHLVGLPTETAERIVRADQLDVLIDLAGHTGLNRLPLLARRVAPVQITYLGYPDTTGVEAMDYRMVDSVTDPIGVAEAFHSEKLVRFAPTAWSYLPPSCAPALNGRGARPPGTPGQAGARFASTAERDGTGDGIGALARLPEDPSPRPASPGPREHPPVFGSCNNLAKLSSATLAGWAQLLQAVPQARLLLKNAGLGQPDLAAELRRRLAEAGIDVRRVELAERTDTVAEHLAFYDRIDVALDTFPYHGTTTTCEALWMGVPVVTLLGDRHCARVGASLLTAIGRPEWIAASWAEYAAIAAGLAERRPSRAAVRALMQASPLLDHAGQAARFAAAVQDCWVGRVALNRPLLTKISSSTLAA